MSLPGWLGAAGWHGHEMIFGVVVAAIAGFLLTSVPVWTGARPLEGRGLAALVALWVAGRLAMLGADALSPIAVAVVDLAFLPTLAGVLARPLLRAEQLRNLGFLGILAALFGANLVMHAQAAGIARAGTSPAIRFAVDLGIVLIVIVGGRITPAFTRNALARSGIPASVRFHPWLGRLAIASVVGLAAADLVLPRTLWSGAIALVAALAVCGRMIGWQTLRTGGDPLLWSLHLGYAWVAVGLGLVAIGDLTAILPPTAGLHALTSGAMGSMILAVMTRVGLGHTGRPLVPPRGTVVAYVLVSAGALVRTVGPIYFEGPHFPALAVAGTLWAAAFGLFVVLYAPILTRPRVDGQPG
jgi:uncharacterized protein involved in response to NO